MDLWISENNQSDLTTTSSVGNKATSQMTLYWKIDYLILTVMISVLSFVGIVGNIPVLFVYFRRRDTKASNTFIKILAIVDLLVCLFIMPYTIVYEFHLIETDVICRTFELTRHFTILASNSTLVAIAIERYIAVCQIGTKVNVSGINKGVLGIIIVSAIFAAPSAGTFAVVNASEVEDVECTFPHELAQGRFCHFTYSVMGQTLVTAYQGLLMIMFVVVLIIIVVLYTIVYVVLWNKTKIRRKMNKNRESLTTTDFEGLYLSQNNAEPVATTIEDDKEVTSPCFDSNAPTPINICDNPVNKDASTKDTDQKPARSGKTVHIKSDILVSQQSRGAVAKPVTRRKKVTVSFGSADKPNKKRYYHRRTAKMLFLCTIIYFITWVPFWIDVFGFTSSKVIRYLFFIGHATNPIVYGIVNEQVRRSFKRLVYSCFKRWCGKGKFANGHETSVNSTSGTEKFAS